MAWLPELLVTPLTTAEANDGNRIVAGEASAVAWKCSASVSDTYSAPMKCSKEGRPCIALRVDCLTSELT